MVKNLPATAGEVRDAGSIPGSGRSPGGGHVNPLQYSCLENPMDRGAWWVTVHGVTKSQTRLRDFIHSYIILAYFQCLIMYMSILYECMYKSTDTHF